MLCALRTAYMLLREMKMHDSGEDNNTFVVLLSLVEQRGFKRKSRV